MRQSIRDPARRFRSTNPGSNSGGSRIQTARTKSGPREPEDVCYQRREHERADISARKEINLIYR